MTVGTSAQERRMVGTNEQPVLAVRLQPVVHRSDDVTIDMLDGLDLGGDIPS